MHLKKRIKVSRGQDRACVCVCVIESGSGVVRLQGIDLVKVDEFRYLGSTWRVSEWYRTEEENVDKVKAVEKDGRSYLR